MMLLWNSGGPKGVPELAHAIFIPWSGRLETNPGQTEFTSGRAARLDAGCSFGSPSALICSGASHRRHLDRHCDALCDSNALR
jgi:hypothetical protein